MRLVLALTWGLILVGLDYTAPAGDDLPPSVLQRRLIRHPEAVCNDGSPAAYFVSSHGDGGLLLLLEAGGDCWSSESCGWRRSTSPQLTTALTQPKTKKVHAASQPVLSDDCAINPAFCRYTRVFVHYCSSDKWSGNRGRLVDGGGVEQGNFDFRGHVIVREVVREVLGNYYAGVDDVPRVFALMGQSAGGVGSLSQTEFVHQQFLDHASQRRPKHKISYVTITDSGWNLDGAGFPYPNSTVGQPVGNGINLCETRACNLHLRFAMGAQLWNLTTSPTCAKALGPERRHLCLFGDWAYEHVVRSMRSKSSAIAMAPASPVHVAFFAAVFRYDQWQILNDFADTNGMQEEELRWISDHRGNEYVEQLRRRNAMDRSFGCFIPSCYDHVISSGSGYNEIKAGGTSLSKALKVWIYDQMNARKGHLGCSVDRCEGIHCNPTCQDTGDEAILRKFYTDAEDDEGDEDAEGEEDCNCA